MTHCVKKILANWRVKFGEGRCRANLQHPSQSRPASCSSRRFLVPHQVTLSDVFLLGMLRRGHLELIRPDQLDAVGSFPNLKRLVTFVLDAFPCDMEMLITSEKPRLFKDVQHLTTSAYFIQLIRARDLVKAREVAETCPWAVNGCEPHD